MHSGIKGIEIAIDFLDRYNVVSTVLLEACVLVGLVPEVVEFFAADRSSCHGRRIGEANGLLGLSKRSSCLSSHCLSAVCIGSGLQLVERHAMVWLGLLVRHRSQQFQLCRSLNLRSCETMRSVLAYEFVEVVHHSRRTDVDGWSIPVELVGFKECGQSARFALSVA